LLEIEISSLCADLVVTMLPQGKEAGTQYLLSEEVESVAAATQKLREKWISSLFYLLLNPLVVEFLITSI
jgi:hypothetical protein